MKVFYDNDADVCHIEGLTVGLIGYGGQGRGQAQNLRDAGIKVVVGNREDKFAEIAREDGFKVNTINEAVAEADILMLLIPDQAQKKVYQEFIEPDLKQGAMMVIAHGYSLRYKEVVPRNDLDVVMCAPRMPGRQIREYFLSGHGVPAFVDVFQDATGGAQRKVLALAKAMGFTRPGVLQVSVEEETEIDLLVEQFLVPNILKTIQVSFEEMTNAGYNPMAVLMELYASGEMGEVLVNASLDGLYKTFQMNASPTCQFGIASSYGQALNGNPREMIKQVIERIKSGKFTETLSEEGTAGYPKTNDLWNTLNGTLLAKTHDEFMTRIKYERK